MRIRILAITCLGLVAIPSLAAAQTTAPKKDSGYDVVEFPPDPLLKSLIDPSNPVIRVGPGVVRVTLSRPRVSFVPEMYKSIENL